MRRESESPRIPGFQAEAAAYRSSRRYPAHGTLRWGPQIRPDRFTLTDYDPRWPLLFQLERQQMRACLGGSAVAIEHVGSSSVPHLKGRPEIDILVGVQTLDDVERCAELLAGLGYVATSRPPSPSDGWCLMAKSGRISFEVLIVLHLGPLWSRHLALRDYLRRAPAKARAYERLKDQWAAKYGVDTKAYKEAKKRFWASV